MKDSIGVFFQDRNAYKTSNAHFNKVHSKDSLFLVSFIENLEGTRRTGRGTVDFWLFIFSKKDVYLVIFYCLTKFHCLIAFIL